MTPRTRVMRPKKKALTGTNTVGLGVSSHFSAGYAHPVIILASVSWIAANTPPHGKDHGCANQAVFHHKGIQIRTGVRDNVAHDRIAAAGEVVGQINDALVVCETVAHQHVVGSSHWWDSL